jgi:hypothetical protein
MKKKSAIIIMVFFVQGLMGQATYFGPNYLHVNSGSNCISNVTILDPSVVGNDPSDFLFSTHVKGVPGRGHDAIMPRSRGVWFDGFSWTIFNEYSPEQMDTALAFDIVNIKYSGTLFKHTVTAANAFEDDSKIDNPDLNGHGDAIFFINKTFDNGVYELAHVDIFYDPPYWYIFNANPVITPLQLNSTYNIFVPDSGTSCYIHIATSADYMTTLDHPLLNGNPNAKLLIMHNYHRGTSHLPINDELGVWYDGSHWNIYNENIDSLYPGAGFNVLIMADFPVGIQTTTNYDKKLIVYPNPAKDNISVLLDKAITGSDYFITFSSIDGKILIQKSYHGDMNEKKVLDVSDLDDGLYILTAKTVKGIFIAKVNIIK